MLLSQHKEIHFRHRSNIRIATICFEQCHLAKIATAPELPYFRLIPLVDILGMEVDVIPLPPADEPKPPLPVAVSVCRVLVSIALLTPIIKQKKSS